MASITINWITIKKSNVSKLAKTNENGHKGSDQSTDQKPAYFK